MARSSRTLPASQRGSALSSIEIRHGLSKRFSSDRCDYLFVLVGDGRRWFIPADVVGGGAGIALGGPKYAGYEVDRGRPFVTLAAAPAG